MPPSRELTASARAFAAAARGRGELESAARWERQAELWDTDPVAAARNLYGPLAAELSAGADPETGRALDALPATEHAPVEPPEPTWPGPEPAPWLHTLPWHVLRAGRPIEQDLTGRYYRDRWGHRVREWPDETVEPGARELWERFKARALAERAGAVPKPSQTNQPPRKVDPP